MTTKKAAEKKPRTIAGVEVVEKTEPVAEGLIVMELFVENMMKVRLVHMKPKPGLNIIHGDNGSGKTSLLNALTWGIDGLGTTTTEPIRKGERVGVTKLNIGNEFIVTRWFTRVDPTKSKKGNTYFPKLLIERYNKGPHEGALENPQRLLNEFKTKISFDPLAFIRKTDKEQLEQLRELVTFDLDIDALDAQQDADYEERKLKGREVDGAKARLEGATVPAEGLPEVPIDTTEITKRLEGAANHNSTVAAQVQAKKRLFEQAHELDALNDGARSQEIEQLQARIRELKKLIAIDRQAADQKRVDAHAMVIGEQIDVAFVSFELQAATATNNAIADAARHRRLQQEYDDALAAWTTLDESIKQRTKDREAAIARAKMPIEELGIGDGEVLYQGLPFSQASNAAQIRVSMALGMASNPKLRIMIIKDGSLLDEKGVKLVDELAEAKGFQVFMERVLGIGKAGVLMVDGEASGEEVVTK